MIYINIAYYIYLLNMSVEELQLSSETFYNKSTVLYGVTKSGKSKVIRNILKVLAPNVTQVIVICPSDLQNGDYSGDGLIETPLIHYEFDLDLIKEVFQRNEMMSTIYKKANDLYVLERLFNKLGVDHAYGIVKQITNLRKCNIQKVHDRYLDKSKVASEVKQINEDYEEVMKRFYKTFIRKYKGNLKQSSLENDEKYCLRYLDFDPSMVVIWDDCGSVLQGLSKQDKKIVNDYFVRNRHAMITTLVALQGDKQIHKDIRLNAFNSIFTDPSTATAFFEYKENQFDKELRLRAKEVISKSLVGFQKILYVREERTFYRFTAQIFTGFKFGSRCVNEYCDRVKNKSGGLDQTSKYYRYFAIKDKK